MSIPSHTGIFRIIKEKYGRTITITLMMATVEWSKRLFVLF